MYLTNSSIRSRDNFSLFGFRNCSITSFEYFFYNAINETNKRKNKYSINNHRIRILTVAISCRT